MRKGSPKKRLISPDPRYTDPHISKFINNLMMDGKRSLATRIFYDAIDLVSERTGEEGKELFEKAIANVTPSVEVKSRRVGGATFQVPIEVRPSRKQALSHRWLISFARKRNEKTMKERLAGEIIAASKGEGAAMKKKEDTYRMAEANKAFSHFRF